MSACGVLLFVWLFDVLLRQLPDWLIPFILGALLWFAAHYFILAKPIAQTMASMDCSVRDQEFCRCAAGLMFEADKVAVALYTSSFTMIPIEQSNEKVYAVRDKIVGAGDQDDERSIKNCTRNFDEGRKPR